MSDEALTGRHVSGDESLTLSPRQSSLITRYSSLVTRHSSLATRDMLAVPGLYILATMLLLFRIGSHPRFSYNWEDYTAWGMFGYWDDPSWRIFGLTEGLMTDSGESPLIVLPVWVSWKLVGVGLLAMRVPVALLAAAAVPLLWLLARRLTGIWTATLAAVLLAISPVFLLYGRTATLVGISLLPALATMYVLVRLSQAPHRREWLLALQVLLVLDMYAYAVIRFLWPLSLAILALEASLRREERRQLLRAFAVTAIVLPLALTLIQRPTWYNPVVAVESYYNGRGEQIMVLNAEPDRYEQYVRPRPEEADRGAQGSSVELARRLLVQNAGDLAKLLFDVHTLPALTDFWSPRGRLYPRLLVPFFLIGLGAAVWHARRRTEYRALLMLFLGLSLPLLLTSRVHVGRLIFALPLLLLLVAVGFTTLSGWLLRLTDERHPERAWVRQAGVLLLSSLLIAAVARSTLADYHVALTASLGAHTATFLEEKLPEVRQYGGAIWVAADTSGLDVEAVHNSGIRLKLDGTYRFINLAEGKPAPPDATDTRPRLYYGALLDRLREPESIPGLCEHIYYVKPAMEDQFLSLARTGQAACKTSWRYRLLPK